MKSLLKKEMTLRRQRQQTEIVASTMTFVPPPILTIATAPKVTRSPPFPFPSSPRHSPPLPFSSTITSPPILSFSSEFPPQSPTPNASFESSPLVSPLDTTSSPQAYHELQEEGGTAFHSSPSPPYSSPLFSISLSGEADIPLRRSPSPMSSPPLVTTLSPPPPASVTVPSSPLGSPLRSPPSSSPSATSLPPKSPSPSVSNIAAPHPEIIPFVDHFSPVPVGSSGSLEGGVNSDNAYFLKTFAR